MALSQHLVQKQTQRLVLTQDLRQSIELLTLSNLELQDRIQKEILENPLLEDLPAVNSASNQEMEQIEAHNAADAQRKNREESEGESDVAGWQKENFESRQNAAPPDYEKTESKHQFLQNSIQARESLADHLLSQLRLQDLSDGELRLGEILISAIDKRGFLSEPLSDLLTSLPVEMSAQLPVDLDTAQKILEMLFELDPVGCGARDVAESLLIQARQLYPRELRVQDLLQNHFDNLERLDYRKIEKESGYSHDEIEDALQVIRTLEPYPGSLYESRQPDYIVPDVMVVEVEHEMRVVLNDDWLPELKVNESYRNLLNQGAEKSADQEYLQSKLNAAHWLIKSVRQRRGTLLRVMQAIVDFQQDFFEKGSAALKPLTLKMIAEKVEMHESTISRITTNKYVQTRWGVFELKFFFSSSIRSSSGGEAHSSTSIQDRIKQLIDAEILEKPLSDQALVEKLSIEGVEIARRTVAKYRTMLEILPVDRRRKLKALAARRKKIK